MVRWINLDGRCSSQLVERLGEIFDIHPLVVEDILKSGQRSKVEDYGDYLYIVAKMIYFQDEELVIENVSIILQRQYIISFGKMHGHVFEKFQDRLHKKGTRMRNAGSDYLMYSFLDAIVDGYFDILKVLGDDIDSMEKTVRLSSSHEDIHKIREIKNYMLYIRKYIWPIRDVISWLGKDPPNLITPTTEIYIKDVHDHIIQIMDTTETYDKILTGIMDLHQSNVSYKMNEEMKVLTIISTIFLPITFIAGIYGMNFVYMPELNYRWGYHLTWILMIIISLGMLQYFKNRNWF